jgi:hypothetical protein
VKDQAPQASQDKTSKDAGHWRHVKVQGQARPDCDVGQKGRKRWCTQHDSNVRPLPSEGNALSS